MICTAGLVHVRKMINQKFKNKMAFPQLETQPLNQMFTWRTYPKRGK